MNRRVYATMALIGLSLFAPSCKQRNVGPDPDPGVDPNAPKNIREVTALLRSAGHLDAPSDAETGLKVKEGSREPVGSAVEYRHLVGQTRLVKSRKFSQRLDYSFTQTADEYAILDPWPSVMWPGCLIQGNSIRGNSVPNAIPFIEKRKPGRIMLQVVSGESREDKSKPENFYTEVQKMQETDVLDAQNELLRRHMQSGTPASVSYTMEIVHNIKELAIHTGLDVKKVFAKIQAFAGSELRSNKSYVLVKLYQRFFTMSYQDPDMGFLGAFTPDIQAHELEPFTGPGNPICFVSSVSYGRVYYLLYESDREEEALYAGLHSYFAGFAVNGDFTENEIVGSSRVKMLQRGGDAEAGLKAALSGNPKDIADFILQGARFSTQNVGAPISFTIKHLYDNSLVRMHNTLEYSYNKTEYLPEEKHNNFAIRLKDIHTDVHGIDGWDPSNHGEISLKKAEVRYYPVKRDNSIAYHTFWDLQNRDESLPKTVGIKGERYIHANRIIQMDCEDKYDRVTLSLTFDVHPYARKGGHKDTGTSPVSVTIDQNFRMENGQWYAEDAASGNNFTSPFHYVGFRRKFTNLMVSIQAHYSVYIDNHQIQGQPAQK